MTNADDDPRALERTYAAAVWLAALAYPENERMRDSFAGAIIARRFDRAPARADAAYEATRLACLAQDKRYVEKEIERGARVLNEQRIEAAFMAWPQFCEALRQAEGCAPIADVPTHASRRMLDVVGSHLAAKRAKRAKRAGKATSGGDDAANVQSRVWKKSLPVLHMALALFMYSNDSETALDKFFHDDRWFASMSDWAESIRALVAALFRIRQQWPDAPPTSADMSKILSGDEIPATRVRA